MICPALVVDTPRGSLLKSRVPMICSRCLIRRLAEFIAYAKSHSGELNYGSSGNGSSMHLAGELFDRETGVQMTHIPYSAPGTATKNLLANDIQAMFQLVPGIVGQVKANKVKALAIT